MLDVANAVTAFHVKSKFEIERMFTLFMGVHIGAL